MIHPMSLSSLAPELHIEILKQLSNPHIHQVLPLLRVDSHWRSLTIELLVSQFRDTKNKRLQATKSREELKSELKAGQSGCFEFDETYLSLPKAYVLVEESGVCPQEGAHSRDDPRYAFTRESAKERDPIYMLYDSYDPDTMIVTFKPPQTVWTISDASSKHQDDLIEYNTLQYSLTCNKEGVEYPDVPRSFNVLSSKWFRPNRHSLWGKELAARPDRFPTCYYGSFTPDSPQHKDASVTYHDLALDDPKTWQASFSLQRYDIAADSSMGFGMDVPSELTMIDLKIPLIDLFCPRETLTEKGYYSD